MGRKIFPLFVGFHTKFCFIRLVRFLQLEQKTKRTQGNNVYLTVIALDIMTSNYCLAILFLV
jgi:hypothetical protein